MTAKVIVEASSRFNQWITDQQASVSADPVERGRIIYSKYGCNACHSMDGKPGIGPSMQGIYGQTVEFEGGTYATIDEAYLKESILNPGKDIVKGFTNVMPANIGSQLSDEQLGDLIEFIKSLK